MLQSHLLLVAVVVLTATWCLFTRYKSPLSRYPGPVVASCSRLWKVWVTYGGHSEHEHIDVHRRHGAWFFCACVPLTSLYKLCLYPRFAP